MCMWVCVRVAVQVNMYIISFKQHVNFYACIYVPIFSFFPVYVTDLLISLLEFVDIAVTNTSPTVTANDSTLPSKSSAVDACI